MQLRNFWRSRSIHAYNIPGDRWHGDVSNSGSFVRGAADRSLGGYGIASVKSMRESLEAVSRLRSMQVKDALAYCTGDRLGPVDFDVATNSQGMAVKSFTVKTLARRVGCERCREARA